MSGGVHVPNLFLVKEVGYGLDYDKYEDGTVDVYVLLKKEVFPVLAVHEWGVLVLIDGTIHKWMRAVVNGEYAIGEKSELSRPKVLKKYIQVTDFNENDKRLYEVRAQVEYERYLRRSDGKPEHSGDMTDAQEELLPLFESVVGDE